MHPRQNRYPLNTTVASSQKYTVSRKQQAGYCQSHCFIKPLKIGNRSKGLQSSTQTPQGDVVGYTNGLRREELYIQQDFCEM